MKLAINISSLVGAVALAFGIPACNNAPSGPGSGPDQVAVGAAKGSTSSCVEYEGRSCLKCTRTHGYWKEHTEKWPCFFPPETTPLCQVTGITLLTGMTTEPNGNAFWILAMQFGAAVLNKAAMCGEIPAHIQAAIDEAAAFFHERLPSDPMTAAERTRALQLAALLDSFNNGLEGPKQCD